MPAACSTRVIPSTHTRRSLLRAALGPHPFARSDRNEPRRRVTRWAALLLCVACAARSERAPQSPKAAPDLAEASSAAPEVLSPASTRSEPEPARASEEQAASPARLVSLPVPGFLDAVLFVPGGAAAPKLVVATHGAGGDPEWTCAVWAKRTRGEAVVLCPRGRAISNQTPQGYYYPDHHALEAEVVAALSAAEAELGARAPKGEGLYTGYSQGATMGALFLTAHAARFPRLVLTEGGFEGWTRARAEAYASAGGKRVLFVCGGRGCQARAEKARALLQKAGVAARVDHVEGGGHTDGGRVGAHLDSSYEWVFAAE